MLLAWGGVAGRLPALLPLAAAVLLCATVANADLLAGELDSHPLVHYNDTDGAVVHLDHDSLHNAVTRGEAWLGKFFIPKGYVRSSAGDWQAAARLARLLALLPACPPLLLQPPSFFP